MLTILVADGMWPRGQSITGLIVIRVNDLGFLTWFGNQKESSYIKGNWILGWRRRWDSNPRTGFSPVYPISSRGRYDHFDTPPCIFRQRSNLNPKKRKMIWKELTERTTEYLVFEPLKNRTATGFVRYETHSLNGDFECCTFDHSDNSPYISTVFRALRKCKKNRQERYEILKFELAKALINQGFSAEKTARANAHFESAPL